MGAELYLDTARLGRMCPGARLAEQEFGWLVSRLGSSLYLEQFLIHGVQSLPVRYRRRVPHLQCWRGVAGFCKGLAEFVSQPEDCETHFFAQSSALIRFAADCLLERAHRVLVTDLGWPAYTVTLHDMAFTRRKSLHVVSLKDQVLHEDLNENELIEQIVAAYQQRGCDAVFLSDVSHLGVRLPVERILARLDEDCRFSVVDGAQAFNQRPVDLSRLACDLYLAGSQNGFALTTPCEWRSSAGSATLSQSRTSPLARTRSEMHSLTSAVAWKVNTSSFGIATNSPPPLPLVAKCLMPQGSRQAASRP